MATTQNIAQFFFLSLSFGVGFFSFLIPTEKTGAGIVKVMSAVTGVSSAIAWVLNYSVHGALHGESILYGLSFLSYLMIYLFHGDHKSFTMWVLYFIHSLSLASVILSMSLSGTAFFFLITSALFLGSVTFAMIKGHWYLVTPKLSEKPLIYACFFIWIFLGIKVCYTTFGTYSSYEFFQSGSLLGEGSLFNWLMLTMRVVWGQVVILIMSLFAYKLVKMRSIQSATGVFYAMTIFIFIGELISSYLFFKHGLTI